MNIGEELKEIVSVYEGGAITIMQGLERDIYNTVRTIAHHAVDQHITGERDPDTGGIKPFYNISRYRVNVAVRATEFSTKDMRVEADDPNYSGRALALNKKAYQWMKETGFARVLNKAGWVRAEYGTAFVKKTEKNGELYLDVPYWHNLIVDPYDLEDGVIIEKHAMNPVQLNKMRGVWDDDAIDQAIEEVKKGTEGRKDRTTSTNSDVLTVYEVEGVFPKKYIDENADDNEYSLQCHYVAGDDFNITFYSEEIKESRYRHIHWQEIPGSALGQGIVEQSFQAQAWTNIAKLQESRMMDYGSKIVLKTPDTNIASNVLTEVVNGQIIQGELQQVDLTPRTIGQLEQLFQSWDTQVEKTTHTFNAVTGENMPSNTPLGAVQIQNANGESYFAYRRQEMGIFWTEIFQDWVMPFIIKQINKEGFVTSEFTETELANLIDEVIIDRYVTQALMVKMLNGEPVEPDEQEKLQAQAQKELKRSLNKRKILLPKDAFKDAAMHVTWVTTNEQKNKIAVLQNLTNVLNFLQQNPNPQGPAAEILGRIIEVAGLGISPASLRLGAPQGQQGQPQGQGQLEQPQGQEVKTAVAA